MRKSERAFIRLEGWRAEAGGRKDGALEAKVLASCSPPSCLLLKYNSTISVLGAEMSDPSCKK
jgi:hypothetical protein